MLEQIQLIDVAARAGGRALQPREHQARPASRPTCRTNARHLGVARGSLQARADAHLSRRLVDAVLNGGEASTLEVAARRRRASTTCSTGSTRSSRVGEPGRRVVGDVTRFRAEVQQRKQRLEARTRRAARGRGARAAEERRSIERQLAERQRCSPRSRARSRSSQAEEARARPSSPRRREARLAQQRTAAAARRRPRRRSDRSSPRRRSRPSATASAAPPSRYGGVVGIAMQYLGVPYCWGGAARRGFDCSGFVDVRLRAGRRLAAAPRRVAVRHGRPGLAATSCSPATSSSSTASATSGIYIGGGAFIHSPHTGDVVKISSLDDSWYSST